MPNYPEIVDLVRRHGHRLTAPRRRVIEVLSRAKAPLSVKAMHGALGHERADLVTVYRTLHWLIGLNIARLVVTGAGAETYEIIPERHTHHLVCDLCGTVETVAVCGLDRSVIERIEQDYCFHVDHHQLVFRGRCSNCMRLRSDRVND